MDEIKDEKEGINVCCYVRYDSLAYEKLMNYCKLKQVPKAQAVRCGLELLNGEEAPRNRYASQFRGSTVITPRD